MSLIALLIWLIVLCGIIAIVFWAFGQIPNIPPPIKIVIVVICAIICILILLSLTGAVTGVGPMLRL